MKTIAIGWLNKCRCGNKSHTVKTARGNETALWDDDAVKCNSCGREGVIQVCEDQARVLWETDEEMSDRKPMTFTKEQLTSEIETLEHFATNLKWTNVKGAQSLLFAAEVMRQALAGMEAEPVAYVDPHAFQNFSVYRAGETDNKRMGREWMWANPDAGLIPVYSAPQPLTTSERAELENYRNAQQVVPGELTREEYKRRFMEEDNFDDTFRGGWNACRAAMQPAAVKDGWVACSERMPEKADEVLCAKEFDGPGDWRQKVGYYLAGKWTVYSASWTPTHWQPLPAAPQQEAVPSALEHGMDRYSGAMQKLADGGD